MKGVNLLSKTRRKDKSNLKLKTDIQELSRVDRVSLDRQSLLFSAAIPSSLCACSRNTEVISSVAKYCSISQDVTHNELCK